MAALMFSAGAFLAALFGGVCVIGKFCKLSILFGAADMLLTVLSMRGFREMMVSSGKILTADWLGFGYNKPVLCVYAAFFVFGAVCVIIGALGVRKKRTQYNS